MKEQSCCFTGHRKLSTEEIPTIKKRLLEEVENLVNQGVYCFLAGGAIGFDTLAAQCVLELKEIYPNIQLHLILPFKKQSSSPGAENTTAFDEIYSKAQNIQYISDHYYNGCMQARNRHLVDHSRYCICYIKENKGGTAYTFKYATQKKLAVIDINCKQLSLFD